MKPVIVGVVVALALYVAPPRAGDAPAAPATPVAVAGESAGPSTVDAERERIARHLRRAERHLEGADVAHLDADQRRARAAAIGHLRTYRERGEFPHNHDFAERRPFFVDHRGVPCAMAYLIARAGDGDLVASVAHTANNAYVRELAADPRLAAWLERNGMSAAEAALVQPTYGPSPGPGEPDGSLLAAARDHYGVVGTATLAADAAALYLLDSGQRAPLLRRLLPVVAGTAGAVAGLSVLGHGGGAFEETLAVANVATGVTTAAFGIAALLLADADAAEGAPAVTTSGIEAALRLTPGMAPGPGLRPQLGVTVRF